MQAGDRLDQRQAEAAAGGRAAAVEAVEAVEHLVVLGFGNAGAVVGDLDLEAGARLAQRQRHGRAGRRVAQRVLDQVRDHLGQQLAVAGQADAVLDLVVELVVGILGGGLVGLADAAHQLGQVDLGEARCCCAPASTWAMRSRAEKVSSSSSASSMAASVAAS